LVKNFPAFISANVSAKAKAQGAVESRNEGKGYYLLRSLHHSFNIYVDASGNPDVLWDHHSYAGLRLALSLIYNPQSRIVKKCGWIKRNEIVKKAKDKVKIKSKAPVVKFGKIQYIWTNKEDCESGKSQVMKLISLDLVEKANLFVNEDYAAQKNLRAQCERVAFENATEEEKEMVVEVTMSSEDNYEKLTYSHPDLENTVETENEIKLNTSSKEDCIVTIETKPKDNEDCIVTIESKPKVKVVECNQQIEESELE